MRAIRKRMHIDRADQITVAGEAAGAAGPVSAPGLVTMPAPGTLATCSSFRASRARDVSVFGFVGKILDIFAIFPQRHALVVVSALVRLSDAMRIANENHPDLVVNTKVNHVPSGFMACITHTPVRAFADRFLGALQFFPAARVLLAPGLLFGQLSHLPAAIRISWDGRGRALDNIFVERLWRSVKYEDVSIKEYQSVSDAVSNLRA